MQSRFVVPGALCALFGLAACTSGASAPAVPAPLPLGAAAAPAAAAAGRLAPAQSAGAARFSLSAAGYLPPSGRSVTVSLTAVNGVPIAGPVRSLTTNLADLAGCGSACTVAGPPAPAGNDSFAFAVYDAPNGKGHLLAVAARSLTIFAGKAAQASVTPRGVPASFGLENVPTATAGVAFVTPQPVKVVVKDAGGNPISGTYAETVWIDDLDSSGATSFAASGADAPPLGQLFSSTDTVALTYTGLAIAPVSLLVGARNSTTLRTTFAPAPSALIYQGPAAQGQPEIDLFAAAGSGSSATFGVSEQGWSNAPFGKPFSASPAANCARIATVSPASGTAFTVHAVSAPEAGTCAVTVADGLGHSRVVTVTYATTSLSAS